MRGRRDGRGLVAAPEGLRDLAGVRGDAPSNISDQAPLVWRAPEGPEGLAAVPVGGGGAWPEFEATRRATSATRHHKPRPIGGRREACGAWPGFEPTRRAKLAARTASGRAGRAAAGDQAGRPRSARNTSGATRNAARTRTERTPTTPGTP